MNRFDSRPTQAGMSTHDRRNSISKEAYVSLIGALAEDPESPSSSIGTFVANSERRKLKALIERLLCPQQ